MGYGALQGNLASKNANAASIIFSGGFQPDHQPVVWPGRCAAIVGIKQAAHFFFIDAQLPGKLRFVIPASLIAIYKAGYHPSQPYSYKGEGANSHT